MINLSALRPDTIVGKIVRYPLRILPRDMVVPIVQGPLRGKKWIAASHLHSCWLGSYEIEMQKRVAKEVKRGDVFYDVGANVGFYSLLAATLVAPGHVYAMEPLPANLAYLRKHLELNHVGNVEVLEVAISDCGGTTFFQVEETRAMGRIAEDGGIRVEMSTLDTLLAEGKVAPPNFIKMDIEGAEFRGLVGARECFARYRPKLFLATHGKEVHDQCCRLLSSWDYTLEYTARESTDRAELFAFSRAEKQRTASA